MGSWLQTLTTRFHLGSTHTATAVETGAGRISLGLEQFVPVLTEVEHAFVLDLGCVWQSTVGFFTGAGCKVYTEDLFRVLSQAGAETSPEAPPLAQRFLAGTLQYPSENFRGILAWDLFDYLPEELVQPMAARLYELLGPGGCLLVLCHNRLADTTFTRYRVLDARTLQLLPDSLALTMERTYANRALLNLFAAFRSLRNFVGRDNLRELFLVK